MRFTIILLLLVFVSPALGQSTAAPTPPTANTNAPLDINNPISILQNAAQAFPESLSSFKNLSAPTTDPNSAAANAVPSAGNPAPGTSTPTTSGGSGGLSTSLSIIILLTVLTLAPSVLVMTTAFTRIIIVLSLLRQAIGTQSLPPSQVIVGLALFLTLIVMAPTFERINREAIIPLQNQQVDQTTAWGRAKEPLRDFMFAQIDHAGNWDDVYMILDYRDRAVAAPKPHSELTRGDVDMLTLIPAFMLSELKVAFLMAFKLYLPFLIIDMVVSSVLLSMGMMMLPPVLVSLPFKLLLFVLVDGWRLVVASLLHSFVT